MESKKTDELPANPKVKSNVLSNMTFMYTLPLFFKGRRRPLTPEDLYKPLDEHKSCILGDRMWKAWEKQLNAASIKNGKPSLLKATLHVFGWAFAQLGIISLILEFCLRVTQPYFLGGLLNYYMKKDSDIMQAYRYAGAIIACSAVNVLTAHTLMLAQLHCGMRIRIGLVSIIYRKALRLSQTALGNTTTGKIVNLLSNDVGKLDYGLVGLHQLWIGPLQIIVVIFIIYQQIGVAALAGVGFLLAFMPLQTYIGKKTSTFRAKTAIGSDERIRLMNEIILGIQVIKMYAWEKPFGKLVASARKREVNTIRYTSYLRAIMLSFNVFITRFSVFLSLIVYALLGKNITAEKAFVVTAYYNILRHTMTVHFSRGITQLAEIFVSFNRIQQFLMYEETKVNLPVDDQLTFSGNTNAYVSVTDKNNENEHKPLIGDVNTGENSSQGSLKLRNVKAKWDPESIEYTLNDVSLTTYPGELVAIIGLVGAGKSSLIQAVLGELSIESGEVEIDGLISYASQDPWLFGGTVQQNILFGQPMDKNRYKAVIKQCALEQDLKMFPYGDRTVVGDRGQALSGGQKARINLARAVYRKASIYLFDDPLSAVDTHVGRHLFEQCMRNYLKNHTVILATHQLQYLQQADKIVIMDHGKVSATGTYAELKDLNNECSQLLLAVGNVQEAEEIEDSELFEDQLSRQNSVSSVESTEEIKVVDTQMHVKETQQHGTIGFSLYKKYFTSGGGPVFLLVTFTFCLFAQLFASASDYFLSYWVNKETSKVINANSTLDSQIFKPENMSDPNTTNISSNVTSDLPPLPHDMTDGYIFTGLVVATIVVTISRSFLVFDVALNAARKLHDQMYHGITRASMHFFNINPAGRILNRFAKDMGQVDETLPAVILEVAQIFLTLMGIVVVIMVINIWFIIPTICMIVFFYNLRSFYLKTSRNVKRMEGVARSPIFSHLSASLLGLSTIRAFGAQKVLFQEFDQLQDLHSSAFYMFLSISRAFGFWLDSTCVIYIAMVTLSFFISGEEQAGNVGLAITQALLMTGMVQWGMRQSAELENTMTAVERIVEYGTLEKEGELESDAKNKLPVEWPEKGNVKFEKLSLRYFPDPNSEQVLKDLEFEIAPKEKVGIVGRTGAGKSSIINALFRLAYNDGSVIVDGRDTNSLGLHNLRSKISIIPQEPVLFSGTMRYNLDPFNEYSDSKIWHALEQVKLKEAISEQALGLQSRVTEGGTNFSTGQRQLICLARAILRENNILVLDEATANVDHQTDNLIQTTIRNQFRDCTVITIAHRLNTIMDSDKVLVMDAGRIVEYGEPYILLTESKIKVFYEMLLQTGEATFKSLFEVAKKAHEGKRKA